MANLLPAWTPQRVDQLRHLIGLGLSTARIAREMGNGITRNAVIGKARRLGITLQPLTKSGAPRTQRSPLPRVPKPRIERRGGFKPTPMPAAPTFVAEEPVISIDDQLIPAEQRCTLLDLKKDSCRWPVGDPILDPANFFFCGAVRAEGSSYCRHHDRRSKQ